MVAETRDLQQDLDRLQTKIDAIKLNALDRAVLLILSWKIYLEKLEEVKKGML